MVGFSQGPLDTRRSPLRALLRTAPPLFSHSPRGTSAVSYRKFASCGRNRGYTSIPAELPRSGTIQSERCLNRRGSSNPLGKIGGRHGIGMAADPIGHGIPFGDRTQMSWPIMREEFVDLRGERSWRNVSYDTAALSLG
jgi:hypothetical protein